MGDRFDTLAKDAAGTLPRREVFRRIGGGLLSILLASVGLAADNSNSACMQFCIDCCGQNFSVPRSGGSGQEYATCIRNCREGLGTLTSAGALVCGSDTPLNPCPPPARE